MNARLTCRLAVLLLALLCLGPASAAPAQPDIKDARGGPDFASALLRETSVVVSITTTHRAVQANLGFVPDSFAVPAQRPTSRDPWDRTRRTDQERGLASGIVISGDGEILTTAHAVADVERVVVRLADGRQFAGKVIGIDWTTDVALLRIEAHGLPAAAIGQSACVAAGEWVDVGGVCLNLRDCLR
jgi:serine protease Do